MNDLNFHGGFLVWVWGLLGFLFFVFRFCFVPIIHEVILYLYKEYLNYNNSFVRKRSDQVYLPPTRE